jgi:hypothetical protein
MGTILEPGAPADIVVFGDLHRCPSDAGNADELALAIGDYIYENAPDYAVCIGDLGDFRSVNAFKGGALMGGDGSDEGHDLLADVEVWERGLTLLTNRFRREEQRHKAAGHKERIPDIEWHFLEGNHEEMLRRLVKRYPAIRRLLSWDRLDLPRIAQRHGFEWHGFLEPLTINAIDFQHYFQGLNPKQALAIQTVQSRNGTSSVFGHTHAFDARHWKDAHGRRRTVINTGCAKLPERCRRYEESGILHIKGAWQGEFTYEWIPSERLLRDRANLMRGSRTCA